METMKLIIDIPKEMYEGYVVVSLGRGNGKTITDNLLRAIKKGTPLDSIIADIESARDKDKLCEYPYNRCIEIIKKAGDKE